MSNRKSSNSDHSRGARPLADAIVAQDGTSSRRAFAAMLGGLGAVALAGCGDEAPSAGGLDENDVESAQQALTGTGVVKIADTAANLRLVSGGTTLWVAVLQGVVSAGDGGGGVFYWSTVAKPDDGWSALNAGAGNVAGWRRANPGLTSASSYASLRLLTGGAVQSVAVLSGRTTHGDGGGGLFYWSTAAAVDDDATTLNAGGLGSSSAGWRRIYEGPINIRWLGCIDDGVNGCGKIINDWLALPTTGSFAQLLVPAIKVGNPGFALKWENVPNKGLVPQGIEVPSGVTLHLIGEGRPYINTVNYTESTAAKSVRGAVFRVDAGVTAISAPASVYPVLYLEKIGLLGPGASATPAAHGIDSLAASNFQISTQDVSIFGFSTGFWARGAVTEHGHYNLRCFGNNIGLRIGEYPGGNFNDSEFWGIDLELNRQALVIEHCDNVSFHGGIIQGNRGGVVFGCPNGQHNVNYVCFYGPMHIEANGDTNSQWLMSDPGGTTWTTYTPFGGPQNLGNVNVRMANLKNNGGDSVSSAAMSLNARGVYAFIDCDLNGQLTVPAGSFVRVVSATQRGGFTNYVLDPNARFLRDEYVYGDTFLAVTGTINFDWGAQGERGFYLLNGNVVVGAPTNACNGSRIRLVFRQDSTGGRTVAVSSISLAVPINNVGNVASSRAVMDLQLENGAWLLVLWSGWMV